MTTETARELGRLGLALAAAIPVTRAWCGLVRWLAFKLFDRWFH